MTVTRFAPSPTGFLHLGHAFAAITARNSGDHFLLSIEDLDQGRAREDFVQAIFEDLGWLGLKWEEPVLRQSGRMGAYRDALAALKAQDLIYPCFCSRKEIADEVARASEAPHLSDLAARRPGGPDGPLYPGTCRALSSGEREMRMASGAPYVLRLDTAEAARRKASSSRRTRSAIRRCSTWPEVRATSTWRAFRDRSTRRASPRT